MRDAETQEGRGEGQEALHTTVRRNDTRRQNVAHHVGAVPGTQDPGNQARTVRLCEGNHAQHPCSHHTLTSSPFWILRLELMMILCPLSNVTTSATQLGAHE